MADQILSALQLLLREDMNNMADHMIIGGCVDWADYKLQVGEIQGLAKAERHLLDLVEKSKEPEQGEGEPIDG